MPLLSCCLCSLLLQESVLLIFLISFVSLVCLSVYKLTLRVNETAHSHFVPLSPSTEVFEELTAAVQEKDSLASELHVRHIAIEQLFKNCAKLPWLHISRAGVKASTSSGPVE